MRSEDVRSEDVCSGHVRPEAALPAVGSLQDQCSGHLRSEDLCPEALRPAGHLRPEALRPAGHVRSEDVRSEDVRSEDLRSEDLRSGHLCSEVWTDGPAGGSSGCQDLLPEDLLPEARVLRRCCPDEGRSSGSSEGPSGPCGSEACCKGLGTTAWG